MLREEFINAKRIVIKLGTNVLRNADGEVAISRIYSFIEEMAKLVKLGKEVILVTSGAVGLNGRRRGKTGLCCNRTKQVNVFLRKRIWNL